MDRAGEKRGGGGLGRMRFYLFFSSDDWDITEVLPLEEEVDLGEARPVKFVPLPALGHQVVDLSWARGRTTEKPLLAVPLVPVVAIFHHLNKTQWKINRACLTQNS